MNTNTSTYPKKCGESAEPSADYHNSVYEEFSAKEKDKTHILFSSGSFKFLTLDESYVFELQKDAVIIEFSNKMTRTRKYQQSNSKTLECVILPPQMKLLDRLSFAGCKNLKKVICYKKYPPFLKEKCFYRIPEDCLLQIPEGSMDYYRDSVWNNIFRNIKEIPVTDDVRQYNASINEAEYYAWMDSMAEKERARLSQKTQQYEIPEPEDFLPDNIPFYESQADVAKKLSEELRKEVQISPWTLTSAFPIPFRKQKGCTYIIYEDGSDINISASESFEEQFYKNAKEIWFSEKMEQIPRERCINQRYLRKVVVPSGVNIIGDYAFAYCRNLRELHLPNTLSHIGDGAFRSCEKLTCFEFPERITFIGNMTFRDCISLKYINLHEGINQIGSWAFSGCTSLISVTIPTTLQSIESFAFQDCAALMEVISFRKVPPVAEEMTFSHLPLHSQLFVPLSSIPLYKKTSGWGYTFSCIKQLSLQSQKELDDILQKKAKLADELSTVNNHHEIELDDMEALESGCLLPCNVRKKEGLIANLKQIIFGQSEA